MNWKRLLTIGALLALCTTAAVAQTYHPVRGSQWFQDSVKLGNTTSDVVIAYGPVTLSYTEAMTLVNAAAGSANPWDYTGTLGIMDNSDNFTLFDVNLTNANHTGSGNTVYIMDVAGITADASATETAINIGAGWDYGIQSVSGIRIGTGSTPDVTPGDDDFFVEGTVEVDGATRLDGLLTANAGVTLGASQVLAFTSTTGLMLGGGTDVTPLSTSTADKSFGLFYTKTTATSGTARGLYWKHTLEDTTPSGEAGRFYTIVNAAGANDAHGAHISLGYGASGTCAGESAALRTTLHVPTGTLGGTNGSAYTEIWADAAGSNASNIQFQRYVLGGDPTGAALLDASGVLFSVEGVTSGAGNVFYVHAPTTLAAGLKVRVAGTEYVLPLYTTE